MALLDTNKKIKILNKGISNLSQSILNIKSSPSVIIWLLTKRCNFTCKHCDSHLSQSKINKEDLLLYANKIAKSKANIVVLSGGEPFIVPNIKEIIKILKEANKVVMINTNGYNLEKFADFIIENKVDIITVSFDSHIENEHNSIRNMKNSFSKAIENIDYIKRNRKNNKPMIAVRAVVMKNNYETLPEYISFFKEIADEVKLQPVHDVSDYEGFDSVVDKSVLFDKTDSITEKKFDDVMDTLFKLHPEYKSTYYKNFKKFLFQPESMDKIALNHCLPMWINTLAIFEDGSCKSCSKEIGNIKKDDIETIWNRPLRIEYLRSLSKYGKCNIPCWLNCTTRTTELQGVVMKKIYSKGSITKESWDDFKNSPHYLKE